MCSSDLGQWEVTTQTEMSGMPVQMPARVRLICITSQDMDGPPIGADPSCTISNYRKSGSSATWQMACRGEANMTGEGRIDFHGNTYSGGSVMSIQMAPGQAMQMRMTYSGRRIGNC